MASSAIHGYQTFLKKGDGTTNITSYTAVAEVVSLDGLSIERNMIDVTNMDSPNGWKEFIGGTRDGGELSLEVNFLPDNTAQKAFITDLDATASIGYAIDWNGTTSNWFFSGWPSGFAPKAGIDEELSATLKIKVTGKPTFPS